MALSENAKKNKLEYIREYNRKAVYSGKVRAINLKAETSILDEFDAISQELGLTRPQTLKALCEIYRNQQ